MTLKHGDRIICINDANQNIVREGRTYTVYYPDWMGISPDTKVYIQEHKRFGFSPERFEKVS